MFIMLGSGANRGDEVFQIEVTFRVIAICT